MYTLMLYSLKVGACLAVFYLFFKLLLSRETFHRLNRIVVLAAMVLSAVCHYGLSRTPGHAGTPGDGGGGLRPVRGAGIPTFPVG